jgi:hypothetical protein
MFPGPVGSRTAPLRRVRARLQAPPRHRCCMSDDIVSANPSARNLLPEADYDLLRHAAGNGTYDLELSDGEVTARCRTVSRGVVVILATALRRSTQAHRPSTRTLLRGEGGTRPVAAAAAGGPPYRAGVPHRPQGRPSVARTDVDLPTGLPADRGGALPGRDGVRERCRSAREPSRRSGSERREGRRPSRVFRIVQQSIAGRSDEM